MTKTCPEYERNADHRSRYADIIAQSQGEEGEHSKESDDLDMNIVQTRSCSNLGQSLLPVNKKEPTTSPTQAEQQPAIMAAAARREVTKNQSKRFRRDGCRARKVKVSACLDIHPIPLTPWCSN